MPVTGSSALVGLYTSVQAYFEAVGNSAPVYLGLRFRDLWDTSRVVIIDGEFDGTNAPKVRSAGSFGSPDHKKSFNPRELVSWKRPVTLSIRAVDPTDIDSESAQLLATESLIETTIQAVHNATGVETATGATVSLGQASIDWTEGKALWCDPGSATQQTWGKEFLVSFMYRCTFFDIADSIAFPVPQLAKTFLTTLQSGVTAKITKSAPSAQTAIISGLGLCTPAQVGLNLRISGAASPTNNGTFPIVAFLTSTTLVVANAASVGNDANNGAIDWAVVPPS